MDATPGTPDAAGAPVDPSAVHLQLFTALLGSEPLGQVLTRVARLATQAVPGIDEASITLVEDGRATSVVFTSDLAARLDERQYETGFGPCLEAAATGAVVTVPDTSDTSRFPDFARQAARSGVTRSLSLGMPVQGDVVGGLNLYARTGTGFDDRTVAVADVFAAHAAVAVANAARHARTVDEVAQLREAMASRAVIEQAKGVIIAALGCTPDEAFLELRRLSSDANRKVRDIAAELVARGRLPV